MVFRTYGAKYNIAQASDGTLVAGTNNGIFTLAAHSYAWRPANTTRGSFSIPASPDHLPPFDRSATKVTYDRWHGQRLLDRLGVAPAFPHGFGLSYTTFSIGEAVPVEVREAGVRLAVTVTNTGDRDGRHVVQVYGRREGGRYAGELLLVGFATVEVASGASRRVEVDVSLVALGEWDAKARRRVLPRPADVVLEVGAHAHDPAAVIVPIGSDSRQWPW